MFFILSKILSFIINPVVWIVTFILLGILLKKDKSKNLFLKLAFGTTLFFSNPFIADEVIRLWETPAIALAEDDKYDFGIVLSGMTRWDPQFERVNFAGNVDRLLQALPLHSNKNIKKLILSGGDGSLLQQEVKETVALKKYLKSIGYNTSKVFIEPDSRNTYENAKNTKELLEQKWDFNPNKHKVLLITSSMHMKRSLACFKKQGITCTPYVTNRNSGPRKFDIDHLLIPKGEAFNAWRNLLHEMVGYFSYKLSNYI